MTSITEESEKKHNFKTLIVEDNHSFRKLLKGILHEYFPLMVIEDAGDGREALQKVDSFCPDLILLDIRLPDESGLELGAAQAPVLGRVGVVPPDGQGIDGQIFFQIVQTDTDSLFGFISQRADIHILLICILAE